MSQPRLAFLLGYDLETDADLDAQIDAEIDAGGLDDPAIRSELLDRVAARTGGDEPTQKWRRLAAGQILDDDPPAVWATVQRLLADLEPDAVLDQIAEAVSIVTVATSESDAPFDHEWYEEILDRLPLPSADDVTDTAMAIIRAVPGIDRTELDEAVARRFALDVDDDLFGDVFTPRIDVLDELGHVVWLGGHRGVVVSDLAPAMVLTHRLSDRECTTGVLIATVDLAAFAWLDQLHLAGGRPITIDIGTEDTRWAGPPGWLDEFRPGDLVRVLVEGSGLVQLVGVAEEPAADPALIARVRTAYERLAVGDADDGGDPTRVLAALAGRALPVEAEHLELALQLEDPSTFAVARPPVTDLCAAAGLELRSRRMAHDESVWHAQATIDRSIRVIATARSVPAAGEALRVLQTADLVAGLVAADPPVDSAPSSEPASEHGSAEPLEALRALADPDVLEMVILELFDRVDPRSPAAAPAFIETLLRVARRGRDVAVARYLAAIEAERREDPIEAEQHLEIGDEADDRWEPLIDRLGWYASDRGDAAKAVARWRRLGPGSTAEDDLQVVEPYATTGAPTQGRNEPCACGSGRKYKQCHLGAPVHHDLADRVRWLQRKGVGYLMRRGPVAFEFVISIAQARSSDPSDHDAIGRALDDPLVIDLALIEGAWWDQFLADRGVLLPDDERLLAEAWALVDRSVFEVLAAEPGRGLTVRDLRTGDELDVRERSFSAQARLGELFCTRVLPDGVGHQIVGGLFRVAPGTEGGLLDLLDHGDPFAIAEHVARLDAPPTMSTREGEAMVQCELVVDIGDARAARRLLDATYEGDETDPDRWLDLFPLNEDENVIRAQLALDGTLLTLVTASEERAERVLAVLDSGLGEIRIVADERQPMDAAALMAMQAEVAARDREARAGGAGGTAAAGLGVAGLPDLRSSAGPDSSSPDASEEMATMLDQMLEKMERRWCDEPVPALAGLTPREAAADPTRRESLVRLIATLDDTPTGTRGFRPDRIRALLGL